MKPLALFRTVLAGALLLASGPLSASEWEVDKDKSTLSFEATQAGNAFTGTFGSFDADITLDPADLTSAKIAVTIDLKSIATGNAQRDGALPGSDLFDMAAFPSATFASTAVRSTGGNAYETDGDLSIKGIVKPVTIVFTLDIDGDNAHAKGEVQIVRTDFKVGTGQFAAEAAAGHGVKILIDIQATRK